MTFAQAAQKAIELGGKFDGHELPEDINAYHEDVGDGARRPGPDGRRARRRIRATADTQSFFVGFAEVEVDVETGKYSRSSTTSPSPTSARSSTRAACRVRCSAASMLGIGHAHAQKWVYDQHYGVPLAQAVLSEQAADDPRHADRDASCGASDLPDPETPVARAAPASRRWAQASARC